MTTFTPEVVLYQGPAPPTDWMAPSHTIAWLSLRHLYASISVFGVLFGTRTHESNQSLGATARGRPRRVPVDLCGRRPLWPWTLDSTRLGLAIDDPSDRCRPPGAACMDRLGRCPTPAWRTSRVESRGAARGAGLPCLIFLLFLTFLVISFWGPRSGLVFGFFGGTAPTAARSQQTPSN